MTDFTLVNHGSISVLTPNTSAAREWVEDHIPDDAQWWCGGVVVEPRYVGSILDGIDVDGLTVGG